MRDNLSVIIAVIIGVIVIVFIPVITILQYQNNVAYNMALSLTTEFVENIKQNGRVTAEEYENFLAKLKTTSNSFKVEIEAHRQQLVKGIDENGNPVVEELVIPGDVNNDGVIVEGENVKYDSSIEYTDENLIHFTDDILQELYVGSDKNNNGAIEENEIGIYSFEANDEIYVNVYNTNITTLDKFTSAVFGTQIVNPKKVNISLGGKIFGETQTSFMQTDFANAYAPSVEIMIPLKSAQHTSSVWETTTVNIGQLASTGKEYKKAVLPTIGSEMIFGIRVSNAKNLFRNSDYTFEKEDANGNIVFNKEAFLSGGTFKDDIVNRLTTFIQTNGFTASNVRFVFGDYNTRKDELVYKFYLSGIYLSNYEPDAFFSITIKPGLAAGVGNSLSASVTSEEFLIDVPNEDGPPKIHLTSLPSTIVEGDLVTFKVSATDMSGVSYFNFDKSWIRGFKYDRIDIVKDNKSQYTVSIYGIKEDLIPGSNIITIPAKAAMDYEEIYSEATVLNIGNILDDTEKPQVSIAYTINGVKKDKIEQGDTLGIEIKIMDNSNYWLQDWLNSNVMTLYNKIDFLMYTGENFEEVKVKERNIFGLNKTFKVYLLEKGYINPDSNNLIKSYGYDFDTRTATILLEISDFPAITNDHFVISIKDGAVVDVNENGNDKVESPIILYDTFEITETSFTATGNNVTILVEASQNITNITNITNKIVSIIGATSDSILVNKKTDKSFEIEILNIKLKPEYTISTAKIVLNKQILESVKGGLFPKNNIETYLKDIEKLEIP